MVIQFLIQMWYKDQQILKNFSKLAGSKQKPIKMLLKNRRDRIIYQLVYLN